MLLNLTILPGAALPRYILDRREKSPATRPDHNPRAAANPTELLIRSEYSHGGAKGAESNLGSVSKAEPNCACANDCDDDSEIEPPGPWTVGIAGEALFYGTFRAELDINRIWKVWCERLTLNTERKPGRTERAANTQGDLLPLQSW